MKIVLVGHPGSQSLVPASKYLTSKYLPGFDIRYLNHTGDKYEWSKYALEYIRNLTGPLVIFSLDDYLISEKFNQDIYDDAVSRFMEDGIECVKLFPCSPEEHAEYPVTTQYTIWDRRFLMFLLKQTADPWDFEMRGSKIFNTLKRGSIRLPKPAITYNTSSALSTRWPGVRWDGLNEEDINHIKTNLYVGPK
jgi:hypothetical protein